MRATRLRPCPCGFCAAPSRERPQELTPVSWAALVVIFLAGLLCLMLGAGCGTLAEFLATPAGQAAGTQALGGATGVIANPVNPLAWYDLLVGGLAVAGGAVGLYKTPQAVRAVAKRVRRTPHTTATVS